MPDTEGILVWNTRDPLRGRTYAEFVTAIKAKPAGRVEQAWLFGSWGTTAFGHDSDIDLILVVDTEKPFVERSRDYFDAMDLALEMDLLVYTSQELQALTTDPAPRFWASVVASMKYIM